jgi:hypothetical protein
LTDRTAIEILRGGVGETGGQSRALKDLETRGRNGDEILWLESIFVNAKLSGAAEIYHDETRLDTDYLTNPIVDGLGTVVYELAFIQMFVPSPSVERRNLWQQL